MADPNALATEKEKSAVWREKITKPLDTVKDVQSRQLPELLKLAKTYQSALQAAVEAGMRFADGWHEMGEMVESSGQEMPWGQSFKELAARQKAIDELMSQWEKALDTKFAQTVSSLIATETKKTAQKDKDVRRAVLKYEAVVKKEGTWARKELKRAKDAMIMDTMNTLKTTMDEVEEKRTLVHRDAQHHCDQTYSIIMQALCLALKERVIVTDKMQEKCKELDAYTNQCQKLQPNPDNAPKPEVMNEIYSEKVKTLKKKRASVRDPQSSSSSPASSGDDMAVVRPGSARSTPITTQRGAVAPPAPVGAAPGGAKRTRIRARWAFKAEREGEISMTAGEVLTVADRSGNWWAAEKSNGQRGRIPANYVEVLEDAPPPALPDIAPPAPSPPMSRTPPESPHIAPPHGLPPAAVPNNRPVGPAADLANAMFGSGRGTVRGPAPPFMPPAPPGGASRLPPIAELPPLHVAPLPEPDHGLHDLPPPPMSPQENRRFPEAPAPDYGDDDRPLPLPVPSDDDSRPLPVPRDDEPGLPELPLELPPLPAELPPPPQPQQEVWEEYKTPAGDTYYYNPATGESKWAL